MTESIPSQLLSASTKGIKSCVTPARPDRHLRYTKHPKWHYVSMVSFHSFPWCPEKAQMKSRIGVLESVVYLKHKHYRSNTSVKSLHCLTYVCFHSILSRSICGIAYRMLCITTRKTFCNEESWYRFLRG